jgi:hypothetical protein
MKALANLTTGPEFRFDGLRFRVERVLGGITLQNLSRVEGLSVRVQGSGVMSKVLGVRVEG